MIKPYLRLPLLLLVAAASLIADTINVPGDYARIQEAIDAALGGDTVLVAPGTYEERIDFKGKSVTVQSEHGPEVTVIDAEYLGTAVSFQNGEGPDSILDGFSILEIPATLPGSIPAPYDVPMQARIGLDPESLSNLFVLEVR